VEKMEKEDRRRMEDKRQVMDGRGSGEVN